MSSGNYNSGRNSKNNRRGGKNLGQSSQNAAQNYPQNWQTNPQFVIQPQIWPQIIPSPQFSVNQRMYSPNLSQQWPRNTQFPPQFHLSQGLGNPSENTYSFSQFGNYGSNNGDFQCQTPGGDSYTSQVDVENEGVDEDVVELEENEDEHVGLQFQQTQETFTSLLNQSPFSSSPASDNGGSKVWSTVENDALVSAYMNISCDSVVGTGQKGPNFWKRVQEKYEETRASKPELMPYRTGSSIRGRWGRLNECIMKWIGCYEAAKRRKKSGENDENVLHNAHLDYERQHGGRFLSEQAWKKLIEFPKWEEIIATDPNQPRGVPRAMQSGDSDSSGKRSREEFESDDIDSSPNAGYQRPIGVKKAKAQAKGKGKASTSEAVESIMKFTEQLSLRNDQRAHAQQLEEKRLAMQMEKHVIKKRQMAMEEYRVNFEMMNSLRMNPNRLPHEDQMLADLDEWFKNNRRFGSN